MEIFSKDCTKITGKVVLQDGDNKDSDDEEAATFNLALVKDDQNDGDTSNSALNEKGALSEGKKYSGTSHVEYPFTIKIAKRKGLVVEGTIKWTLQKSKTKFKGKINNNELTFEEYEVVEKGDEEDPVKVPMLYSGKFSDSTSNDIAGTFGPAVNVTKGKFTIKLQ